MVKRKAIYQRRRAPVKRARSSYSSRTKLSTRAPKRRASSRRVGSYMSTAMKVAGGLVGGYLGNPGLGASLGGKAATALKRITGVGDYKINSNTILTDSVPQFTTNGRGMRVAHREYVQDIISNITPLGFQLNQFPLNPGNSLTFPWLATVANAFDQYRIHGCVFEFKSMSSDALNNTNTALGSVVLQTQYNVLDPPPFNKQQMENAEFSASVKPSQNTIHAIECAKEETPLHVLYVRNSNSNITGSDLRLYDYANFFTATTGLQGGLVNVGELWVTYDIEFFKPKLALYNIFEPGAMTHAELYSAVNTPPLTGSPLGQTNQMKILQNQIGVTITGGNTINIPGSFVGYLCITYTVYGATAGIGSCTLPQLTLGATVTGANVNMLPVGMATFSASNEGETNVNYVTKTIFVYCSGTTTTSSQGLGTQSVLFGTQGSNYPSGTGSGTLNIMVFGKLPGAF